MTVNEFEAFIEGMDVGEAPTPEQWRRIKAWLQRELGKQTVLTTSALELHPPMDPLNPIPIIGPGTLLKGGLTPPEVDAHREGEEIEN